jgi:hypothetical protein
VASNVDLLGGEGRQMLEIHANIKVWCGGQWSAYSIDVNDTTFTNPDVCESNNNREYHVDVFDDADDFCDRGVMPF